MSGDLSMKMPDATERKKNRKGLVGERLRLGYLEFLWPKAAEQNSKSFDKESWEPFFGKTDINL